MQPYDELPADARRRLSAASWFGWRRVPGRALV